MSTTPLAVLGKNGQENLTNKVDFKEDFKDF